MRVCLFDRATMAPLGIIYVPDHVLPKTVHGTAKFEIKVNEDLIFEPTLEMRRVVLTMDERNMMQPSGYAWLAIPAAAKSNAMMRLAYHDQVDGIDEVKPQFRPAAREVLRRIFLMDE